MSQERAGSIYHIAAESEWRRAAAGAVYAPASLASEGFVHCSATSAQVLRVASAFFAETREPLLVIRLELARLSARVVFEPPAPVAGRRDESAEGELFPHVYGPLELAAVSGIGVLRGASGPCAWPPRFSAPER